MNAANGAFQGFSKGPTPRQWLVAGVCALGVLLTGVPAGAVRPPGRPTPSGLPVPRWASLKFAEVNARGGPGDDYRLLWTYRVRGLPVQVVAETAEWRRVCDPEGGAAWVHRRMVDLRRTVLAPGPAPLALLQAPKPPSRVAARLAPRALAEVSAQNGAWLRLRAGKASGWVPAAAVWGAQAEPLCR